MENKQCQNCKKDFTIESEDFNFYKKMKVPAPTFCPDCRMIRRMSFLNERTFYKRNCDLTGELIVSLFPENSEVPVYSPKAWWSDEWDAMDYGVDYDFSVPFFEQFKKLLRKVPQFSLQNQYTTMINTEYVNMGTYLKNCYFVFNTAHSEDSFFTTFFLNGKNCIDIYKGDKCELCYESQIVYRCYKVLYSYDCIDCTDVFFSKRLSGCQNCFGCVNLRNKSYHIFNKAYSRESYLKEIKKFNLGSHSFIEVMKKQIEEFQSKFPVKYREGNRNHDVYGDQIYQSRNVHNSFEIYGVEDSKHCQFIFHKPAHDCYDMTFWGDNASRIYECMGAGNNEDLIKFSFDCWAPAINIEYSYHIVSPNKNLFGCIGLKNKEYCILNKQYKKEEYFSMVEKIKKHMNDMPYIDSKGIIYKYGEFFPTEISLFAYNETFAQSYFPLTKEEALSRGFVWKDREENKYDVTIKAENLPDDIKDIDEAILDQVIECQVSKRAFRITPAEFQFYKFMNIPLPRLHPDERHKEKLKKQNPLKLWQRKCMCDKSNHFHGGNKCEVEFKTSYSPDRPEIIYCEKCYQQEIY